MQTVYQVGYRVNDAYAAYKDLGSPKQLTRAQIEILKAASDVHHVEQSTVVVQADGRLRPDLPMRENDAFLITLGKLGHGKCPRPTP